MKLTIIASVIATLAITGCLEQPPSSDAIQHKQQEQISLQAVRSECRLLSTSLKKRMMKDILELRDQNVATITYLVGMNNQLRKLCNSIGFGLPYATQYTNPMRISGGIDTPSTGNVAIPQADPNGLFSPASAEGTWVLCVSPETKKPVAMYVEPRVIVSQFPLE